MSQNGGLSSEIFIVDEDATVRESLSVEFIRAGYRVITFSEGRSFVSAAREHIPACVVIDIFMPSSAGLDILKQLDAANYPAPICIVSGRADISLVVEAVKNGACDFIEKQMDAGSIARRVCETIEVWTRHRQTDATSEFEWQRFPGRDRLTRREVQVLAQIATGATNKAAADALGISARTIETHRGHIMKKLGAKNAVELVRMVLSVSDGAWKHARSHAASAKAVQIVPRTAPCHPE
jgi:two-component system response regulator FixJ